MFCEKCGKPIRDDARFCRYCGESVSPPVEPEEESVKAVSSQEKAAQESPADTQQPDVELTIEAPKFVPEKGKNRKGLVRLICLFLAGAGLLAGIVALALNFDWIHGWYIRSFQTPQDYLEFVVKKRANSSAEEFVETLADFSPDALPRNATYSNALRFTLGDAITEALTMQTGPNTILDVSVTAATIFDNGKIQADVNLLLSDSHIIGAEIYFDTENNKIWLNLPDLSQDALYLDLGKELPDSKVQLQAVMEILQILTEDKETVTLIYNKLSGASAKLMTAESLYQETVTLKDVNQEVTAIQISLHPEQASDALAQAFDELLANEDVIFLLSRLNTPMRQLTQDPELDLVNMARQLQKTLAESKQQGNMPQEEGKLWIYVDEGHNLIGQKMVYADKVVYEELMLQRDDRILLQIKSAEISVEMDLTEKEDLYTGMCQVCDGQEPIMEIRLEGFGVQDKVAKGRISATLLHTYLTKVTGTVSPDVEMLLTFDGDQDNGTATLELEIGGVPLFALSSTSQTLPAQSVLLPEGGVNLLDDQAMDEWLLSLNYDQLIANLLEAGIPETLIMMITGGTVGVS